MKPVLLDLFCGGGGASAGYAHVGFRVVGVDIEPHPRYPFEFVQAGALTVLDDLLAHRTIAGYGLHDIAAIHASPPCQRYSAMSRCRPGLADTYPDLIAPVRERLLHTGKPYVIENVEGAPLRADLMLCGSMFDCVTTWEPYGHVGLRRHRIFESNVPLTAPKPCNHALPSVAVYGGGPSAHKKLKGKGHAQAQREVMGIDWMTRGELNESVPPCYTGWIGLQLRGEIALAAIEVA